MICKVFGIDYFTIYDNDKKEDDEPTNENMAIEKNTKNGKKTKFSTSFEAKLEVTGNNKFQKLVKKIDGLSDKNSLDQEIKNCVSNLKNLLKAKILTEYNY